MPDETYYFSNFDDEDLAEEEIPFNAANYEDAHNLGESISLEDQEILNNLSFDPFHNIKRN